MQKRRYVIGIDEAGRGPLAGPVAVGAVVVSPLFDAKLVQEIKGKDSKKLSRQKREIWFAKMQEWKKRGLIDYHVAFVSNVVIDKSGISRAIKKGVATCLEKLRAQIIDCEIILDGSLRAPDEFLDQRTIIRGDEKEYPISLASIAAKVVRDKKMEKLAEQFPKYNFDTHKGYGTREHILAIKKFGTSVIHRRSFLRNFEK